MDSIIKIGGRELPVHASLKTLIDYKSTFGTDLFEDLDKIQNIKSDCDNDALVIEVIKDGPACHTGAESCFMNEIYQKENYKDFSIYKLYELIRGRKINMTEGSYTTYLFNSGIDKILKKIGEESSEVIIGAKNGSKEEIIYELSDLLYHSLVLMVEKNITLNDIKDELSKRSIIDKKVKQESMNNK